jgi:hypothetical protein
MRPIFLLKRQALIVLLPIGMLTAACRRDVCSNGPISSASAPPANDADPFSLFDRSMSLKRAGEPTRNETNARIAVLDLGTIGLVDPSRPLSVTVMTKALRNASASLEQEGVNVIVLHFRGDADGTLEQFREFAQILDIDLSKRFRTVGWVEHATGMLALAVTGMGELCFTPEGLLGAAVPVIDGTRTLDKTEQEGWHKLADSISSQSGRPSPLFQAMQGTASLSVNFDDEGNPVEWRADERGKQVLNRAGGVLVLTAADARRLHVSIGTAKDRADLASVLRISDPIWVADTAKLPDAH